jgi:tetratricopeptide (TPR) repeat protein
VAGVAAVLRALFRICTIDGLPGGLAHGIAPGVGRIVPRSFAKLVVQILEVQQREGDAVERRVGRVKIVVIVSHLLLRVRQQIRIHAFEKGQQSCTVGEDPVLVRQGGVIDHDLVEILEPDLLQAIANLAISHAASGSQETAKGMFERSLAVRERVLGPEHPDVAAVLNSLGLTHQAAESYEEAKELFDRALAIWTDVLGPDHPAVAKRLNNLAGVRHATGAHDEAKRLWERALATWEAALGSDHPDVAIAHIGLANVALVQDRSADAVEHARRAVDIRLDAGEGAIELAEARFLLARALWDAGRERTRALVLAEQAQGAYREGGRRRQRAAVEAWLADRRRTR